MTIASMGYPDIIAPTLILDKLVKEWRWSLARTDSLEICKRHGLAPRDIPDAAAFFDLMRAKLDVYDIIQERGGEILCDLNKPLGWSTLKPHKAYDIVIDVGTLEHCFNIAQAIFNMASMVKVGGVIIHENPYNWGNHGFYNINPTFFNDFYLANGFEIRKCYIVDRAGNSAEVPMGKRFIFMEGEVNIFTVAERISQQSFVYPTQAKYANLIPAAGVPGEKEKEIAHG